MILNAVQRAFQRDNAPPASAEPKKVAVRKGGLEVIYHVKVGESLCCLAKAPGLVEAPRRRLAAATDDGDVAFLDAADGSVCARSDATDEPPNAMAFTQDGLCLVSVSDDGIARVMDESGALLFAHAVAETPAAGKRARCVAADHLIALGSGGFVAAAGRLVHTCRGPGAETEPGSAAGAPGWQLAHALVADAPIRALCGAPREMPASCAYWAYAAAHKGGIILVSQQGEVVRKLSSAQPLRSLAMPLTSLGMGPQGEPRWLAASTFDGNIELWDVARPAPSDGATPAAVAAAGLAPHRLQSYAGSDGEVLHWSPDGGGIAVSGARAAVFDFTGANPPHPYRKGSGAMGQPDPVPRVCMAEAPVQAVAWAPLGAGEEDRGVHAAATLATLGSDGGVRVWRPRGLPLRRGGKRDPSNYPCNPKPSTLTLTLDPNPRS